MKHKILFFLLSTLILNSASAQYSYLDKTFSSNGIAEVNPGSQKLQNSLGAQVIANADGSLFILFQSSENSFLLKKLANGTTDSSYGMNGLSAPLLVSDPKAVKQPDGKIIIAGHTASKNIDYNSGQVRDERKTAYNEDFALGRINTDGSIDKTFGNKGLQKTDFNTYYDAINSIVLQPDGKILVSGFTALYDPSLDELGLYTHLYDRVAVAKYTNIGLPDLSFDGDGKFITNIRTNDDNSNLLGLQSDGKFVVAASDTTGLSMARFTSSGASDNTFTFTNKLLQADKSYFSLKSLAVGGDNKIVLGGFWNSTNTQKDFVLARFAAGGSIDHSFNGTGIQTTDFRGYDDIITSLVIQSDGKIVTGGYSSNGVSYGFATARYNINGTMDNTYDADGKKVSYHGANDLRTAVISLQPDQKIILSGFDGTQYFRTTNTLIVRYNTNGSVDKSFNKTGGLIYKFKYGNTVFTSSITQTDGKLVTAGYTWNGTDHDFLVVRYNTDGSLDKTFSADGIQITNVSTSDNINTAVALQKDGKIIISGSSKNSTNLDFTLVRYNSNGSLDNTFSGDGVMISDFGTNEDARALTIQSDGKIIIAGSFDGRVAVARYNTNGSIDAGFGSGGKKTDVLDNASYATSIAIDGNGKIVVSGSEEDNGLLFRLNYNGSPDQTFGDNGITRRYGGDFVYDTHIAIQKDNKILFAGIQEYFGRDENTDNVFLLRYNTNGNLDFTFSEDGGLMLPLSDDSLTTNPSIALQADGKIIFSSRVFSFWEYGYKDKVKKPHGYIVSRIKTNGSFDSTFGRNGLIYTNEFPNAVVNNVTVSGNKFYAVGYDKVIDDHRFEILYSLGYAARYDLLTANTPPKVSITSPANNKNFASTTTAVTVNATATDADAPVYSVKIYLNDSYVRTDFTAPYTFGLSGLSQGVYVVRAKATDNLGVETFSAAVIFTIGTTTLQKTIASSLKNTSVNADKLLEPSATISPNPAKNILTVSTKGFTKNGAMYLSVLSTNGTMMKQMKVNEKTQTISVDISTLQSGTYSLQLKSKDKVLTNQFIKL